MLHVAMKLLPQRNYNNEEAIHILIHFIESLKQTRQHLETPKASKLGRMKLNHDDSPLSLKDAANDDEAYGNSGIIPDTSASIRRRRLTTPSSIRLKNAE